MELHFEYFDFIPRKEFEVKANQLLNHLKTEVPFSYECEARCTYFANKFFFQIVFRGEEEVLSAQSILDPNQEDTSTRGWQIIALDKMSSLLERQLSNMKTITLAA